MKDQINPKKGFFSILLSWALPIVWAVVIFTFSSMPTIQTFKVDWQDFIIKKLAHMTEYGILGSLVYRSLKLNGVDKRRAAILGIIIAAIYGITDEFHQSFIPGREPRVRDVIFDTIGATLVVLYLWKLLPKAPKRLLNLVEKLGLL